MATMAISASFMALTHYNYTLSSSCALLIASKSLHPTVVCRSLPGRWGSAHWYHQFMATSLPSPFLHPHHEKDTQHTCHAASKTPASSPQVISLCTVKKQVSWDVGGPCPGHTVGYWRSIRRQQLPYTSWMLAISTRKLCWREKDEFMSYLGSKLEYFLNSETFLSAVGILAPSNTQVRWPLPSLLHRQGNWLTKRLHYSSPWSHASFQPRQSDSEAYIFYHYVFTIRRLELLLNCLLARE